MTTLWQLLEGAWHVLLAGLLLGAGLPAIFALGIQAWTWGADGIDTITEHKPHLIAKILAALCFGIVLVAIIIGIGIIVAHGFGWKFVLEWPLFVPH